jgi:hypothetical protein
MAREKAHHRNLDHDLATQDKVVESDQGIGIKGRVRVSADSKTTSALCERWPEHDSIPSPRGRRRHLTTQSIGKTWRLDVMCVLYGHQNINESTEHPMAKSVAPIHDKRCMFGRFGTCIRDPCPKV